MHGCAQIIKDFRCPGVNIIHALKGGAFTDVMQSKVLSLLRDNASAAQLGLLCSLSVIPSVHLNDVKDATATLSVLWSPKHKQAESASIIEHSSDTEKNLFIESESVLRQSIMDLFRAEYGEQEVDVKYVKPTTAVMLSEQLNEQQIIMRPPTSSGESAACLSHKSALVMNEHYHKGALLQKSHCFQVTFSTAIQQSIMTAGCTVDDDEHLRFLSATTSGNDDDSLLHHQFALSAQTFAHLFPFYFIIDQQCCFLETGTTKLRTILRDAASSSFNLQPSLAAADSHGLYVVHPAVGWDFSHLTSLSDSTSFLLGVHYNLTNLTMAQSPNQQLKLDGSLQQQSPLLLRGQFVKIFKNDAPALLFVGSPYLSGTDKLKGWDIHWTDLPLHDMGRCHAILGEELTKASQELLKLKAEHEDLEKEIKWMEQEAAWLEKEKTKADALCERLKDSLKEALALHDSGFFTTPATAHMDMGTPALMALSIIEKFLCGEKVSVREAMEAHNAITLGGHDLHKPLKFREMLAGVSGMDQDVNQALAQLLGASRMESGYWEDYGDSSTNSGDASAEDDNYAAEQTRHNPSGQLSSSDLFNAFNTVWKQQAAPEPGTATGGSTDSGTGGEMTKQLLVEAHMSMTSSVLRKDQPNQPHVNIAVVAPAGSGSASDEAIRGFDNVPIRDRLKASSRSSLNTDDTAAAEAATSNHRDAVNKVMTDYTGTAAAAAAATQHNELRDSVSSTPAEEDEPTNNTFQLLSSLPEAAARRRILSMPGSTGSTGSRPQQQQRPPGSALAAAGRESLYQRLARYEFDQAGQKRDSPPTSQSGSTQKSTQNAASPITKRQLVVAPSSAASTALSTTLPYRGSQSGHSASHQHESATKHTFATTRVPDSSRHPTISEMVVKGSSKLLGTTSTSVLLPTTSSLQLQSRSSYQHVQQDAAAAPFMVSSLQARSCGSSLGRNSGGGGSSPLSPRRSPLNSIISTAQPFCSSSFEYRNPEPSIRARPGTSESQLSNLPPLLGINAVTHHQSIMGSAADLSHRLSLPGGSSPTRLPGALRAVEGTTGGGTSQPLLTASSAAAAASASSTAGSTGGSSRHRLASAGMITTCEADSGGEDHEVMMSSQTNPFFASAAADTGVAIRSFPSASSASGSTVYAAVGVISSSSDLMIPHPPPPHSHSSHPSRQNLEISHSGSITLKRSSLKLSSSLVKSSFDVVPSPPSSSQSLLSLPKSSSLRLSPPPSLAAAASHDDDDQQTGSIMTSRNGRPTSVEAAVAGSYAPVTSTGNEGIHPHLIAAAASNLDTNNKSSADEEWHNRQRGPATVVVDIIEEVNSTPAAAATDDDRPANWHEVGERRAAIVEVSPQQGHHNTVKRNASRPKTARFTLDYSAADDDESAVHTSHSREAEREGTSGATTALLSKMSTIMMNSNAINYLNRPRLRSAKLFKASQLLDDGGNDPAGADRAHNMAEGGLQEQEESEPPLPRRPSASRRSAISSDLQMAIAAHRLRSSRSCATSVAGSCESSDDEREVLSTEPQPEDAEADQLIKQTRRTMRRSFSFGGNRGLQGGSWLSAIAWNSVIRRTDSLRVGSLGSFTQRQDSRSKTDPQESSSKDDLTTLTTSATAAPTVVSSTVFSVSEIKQGGFLTATTSTEQALALYDQQPKPEKGPQDQLAHLLANIEEWQYDVFALEEATQSHALSVLGFALITRTEASSRFNMDADKLARFLMEVESGYTEKNYHCATHGADVLRTLHVLGTRGGIWRDAHCSEVGIMAMYLSAIIHDYEHVGFNNDFLVKTQNELSIRYNDRSPMENHHIASAWALLRDERHNFIDNMPAKAKEFLRKLVIECVLSTDMKQHFSLTSLFSSKAASIAPQAGPNSRPNSRPGSRTNSQPGSRVNSRPASAVGEASSPSAVRPPAAMSLEASSKHSGFKTWDDDSRLLAMQMSLKSADLGHLAGPLNAHLAWVQKLEKEMFKQGDEERALGLPISPLMDRESGKGVTKSQTGFLNFVALPLYKAMAQAFPDCQPILSAVNANYVYWSEQEKLNMT